MSLRVRCTQCRAAFLVPEEHAGRVASCPKCGTPQKTPGLAPAAEPVARPIPEGDEVDEVASVFHPSPESVERTSTRRRWIAAALLLATIAVAAALLVLRPWLRPRSNDPAERVAEEYLQALVDRDEDVQRRLGVIDEPPAIQDFRDVRRDKGRDHAIRGSFAPIATLNRRIDEEYAYDPAVGRFTPRNPLGPAAETLDALHAAKADAETSGLYDKMASGDPDDLFDAAEGLGQVFRKLAEGTLAPKKILPTYKMLVEEAQPPLPPDARELALAVSDAPKTWDALLKRPFHILKADGPFILERADVDAQVVDALASPGDPPTAMRLSLVRFRLEGIDTSWRVVEARRLLPTPPQEPPPSPSSAP